MSRFAVMEFNQKKSGKNMPRRRWEFEYSVQANQIRLVNFGGRVWHHSVQQAFLKQKPFFFSVDSVGLIANEFIPKSFVSSCSRLLVHRECSAFFVRCRCRCRCRRRHASGDRTSSVHLTIAYSQLSVREGVAFVLTPFPSFQDSFFAHRAAAS